jgi:hypothetical protein
MMRFETVWFQQELPEASQSAMCSRRIGTLSIHGDVAEFQAGDHRETLSNIRAVSSGKRGSDFINRWVEVEYGEVDTVVYLKDGRWRGWRPLLTPSNKRIARALQSTIAR